MLHVYWLIDATMPLVYTCTCNASMHIKIHEEQSMGYNIPKHHPYMSMQVSKDII